MKNNPYLVFIEPGVFQYFHNLDGAEITKLCDQEMQLCSFVSYLLHAEPLESHSEEYSVSNCCNAFQNVKF